METSTSYVYQQPAVEFVTVAVEMCRFLEQAEQAERPEFIHKTLCFLPLLYLKAQLLDKPSQQMDGYPQAFVTEQDYNAVQQMVQGLLGSDDAYLDVFVEDMKYSDEPVTCYISENIADIYQELKDLVLNYQTADERVMNDALLDCLEQFELHWGQKLLNAARALHTLSLEQE